MTCNYIIKASAKKTGQPRTPQVLCGKPATHSLPPLHRIILCAEHARENWGNPPPVPLKEVPRVR
jgi:hypothetical protein